MGIELYHLSFGLIQSALPLFILLVFIVSVVLIITGIFGRLVLKNGQKSGTKLLKIGSILLGVGIFYIIISIALSIFGLNMSSSFTGDTLVWTSEGKMKISDLDIGDVVKGYDANTNSIVDGKVELCRNYKVNSYYLINGTLKVTSEHPLAVKHSKNIVWKKVKELAIGDELVTPQDLRPLFVESIEETQSDKSITVYNPQVSGSQNYFVFVGDSNAVLVHNKTKLPGFKKVQPCEHNGS